MYLSRRELGFPGGLSKEWLSTNGLGGYASSTVLDVHTRRYHGWLVAAADPPSTRIVSVSRFVETALVAGSAVEFSSAEYPGVFHPRGFENLVAFWDDPVPSFEYALGGLRLVRQVFLPPEKNVCVVVYSVVPADSSIELRLRPLLNWRHFHHLTHTLEPSWTQRISPHCVSLTFLRDARLVLLFERGAYSPSPIWYHQALYREEAERGLDYTEELYSPGEIEATLGGHHPARFVVAAGLQGDVASLRLDELELPPPYPIGAAQGLVESLETAARTFIVRRKQGKSIIAGYHWFGDWGRDTMISLPGLTLVVGREHDALSILETWADSQREGLIPNRFGDLDSAPEWNSVDAPLWFAYAVWKYWRRTEDSCGVRPFVAVIENVVRNYIKGTLFGITMDKSGLVRSGQRGIQLTWMDAKVQDEVVTQRAGYAVDVNALWYNALLSLAALLISQGDKGKAARYAAIADKTRNAFNSTFWNGSYLDDAVPDGRELRPNQILAVSLPFSPLASDRARAVVRSIEQGLLTPYGLRTLDTSHPSYNGRYEGSVEQRDRAYHQGTAWPWLLGQYITALRRLGNDPAGLWRHVLPFEGTLREAGLGTISEIFDGDPPHNPRGCISQAWSVAEILRAIKEDIEGPGAMELEHDRA